MSPFIHLGGGGGSKQCRPTEEERGTLSGAPTVAYFELLSLQYVPIEARSTAQGFCRLVGVGGGGQLWDKLNKWTKPIRILNLLSMVNIEIYLFITHKVIVLIIVG